jgi:hypothetical protein
MIDFEFTDPEDIDASAQKLLILFVNAIVDRATLTICDGFKPGRKPTIQDLAKIEKALNGLLVEVIFHGQRKPKGSIFRFDLQSFRQIDDGADDLVLTLDCAKILGPKAEAR